MRILVTGGAGFVGASLALAFKRDRSDVEVFALDSLKRRGSELALTRLREGGVRFVHGDIRNPEDLDQISDVDLVLECSAEPSVLAGYDGAARQLIHTNLSGTVNCLEFARTRSAGLIFLSTSRVYPIAALRELPVSQKGKRFELEAGRSGSGWSEHGISTEFPLAGARSLYGTTKLCSELLIQEYVEMYGLQAVIDRCGVIAGPWQMGKVDQGFASLWMARHFFGGRLEYRGFGGRGHQVRDVLHVDDLQRLVELQSRALADCSGRVYAVGGGPDNTVSPRELTDLCVQLTGNTIEIDSDPETHPADIPYYVSDNRQIREETGWRPELAIETVLEDVLSWLRAHEEALKPILSQAPSA